MRFRAKSAKGIYKEAAKRYSDRPFSMRMSLLSKLAGRAAAARLMVAFCLAASILCAQVAGVDERAERYLDGYMMSNEGERLEKDGQLEAAMRKFMEAAQVFETLAQSYPGWETNMLGVRRRKVKDAILRVQKAIQQPAPAPVAAPPPSQALTSPPSSSTPAGPASPPEAGSWGEPGEPAGIADSGSAVPSLADVFRDYERQVQDKMQALQRRNLEVEGALRKWDDWFRWASDEIKKERAEKQEIAGKMVKVEGQLAQMKSEVEAGRASQDQLDTLLKEKAALLALEKQINERLAVAEKASAEATEKLAATSRQMASLIEERDQLKAERDAAVAERDAATAEKTKIEGQLAQMQAKPDAAELEKLDQENRRLKEEVTAIKTQLAEVKTPDGQPDAALTAENELLRAVILRQLRNQARQQQVRTDVLEALKNLSGAPDDLMDKVRELEQARLTLTTDEEKLFTESSLQEVAKTGPGVVQATLMASGNEGAQAEDAVPAAAKEGAGVSDLLDKAAAALSKKDYQAAVKYLQDAHTGRPENIDVMISLGDAHLRAGQFEEAEKVLKECLARDPKNASAHHVLGMTYFRSSRMEQAATAFQAALEHDGKQALAHHYLGIIASRKREAEQAEKEFRKALEINPQFGEAHFNLAVLYAGWNPPQWDKARSEYESALGKGVPPDQNLEKLLKQ